MAGRPAAGRRRPGGRLPAARRRLCAAGRASPRSSVARRRQPVALPPSLARPCCQAAGVGRVDAGPVRRRGARPRPAPRPGPGTRRRWWCSGAVGALPCAPASRGAARDPAPAGGGCTGHRVLSRAAGAPGRGPCLRCLDLHRCDRDPGVAGAAGPAGASCPGRAGARGQPRDHADGDRCGALRAWSCTRPWTGRTVPRGVSLEVSLPWPRVEQRRLRPSHGPTARCGLRGRRRQQWPGERPPAQGGDPTGQARRRCRWASPGAPPWASASGSAASPPRLVAAELQARTAEQLFKVLGELKGGAMKFGQALSVFEAAMPEELAGPYRATLTKLQDSAPPMPASAVHKVLAGELGPRWRHRSSRPSTTPPPPRPRSARCTGPCGATGARSRSRSSTPGPAEALVSDLNQLARVARVAGRLDPRHRHQADHGRAQAADGRGARLQPRGRQPAQFAEAFARRPGLRRPRRAASTASTSSSPSGSTACRCRRSSPPGPRSSATPPRSSTSSSSSPGPSRAGLLHADPHPGNFRLLPDGRLGVLDFGAVNRLPGRAAAGDGRAAHRRPWTATP